MSRAVFRVPVVAGLFAGLVSAALLASPVSAQPVVLSTTLVGANEVPGPGDPNATGSASVVVDPSTGELCFSLSVSGLSSAPIAAHIHHAEAGHAGGIVIQLTTPTNGSSSGCHEGVDAGLLNGIATYPFAYYVNVHTGDFPDGAARGQLQAPSADSGAATQ